MTHISIREHLVATACIAALVAVAVLAAYGGTGAHEVAPSTEVLETVNQESLLKLLGYKVRAGDLLVFISTLALAAFTFFVFLATRSLVRSSEKASARQLRAYLYVSEAKFRVPRSVFYIIKNFGLTPAYNVKVQHVGELIAWNDGDPVIPSLENGTELNLGSMAPNGDYYEFDIPVPLASIVKSNEAVYLVGRITYVDVFDKSRTTEFRYYIGGDTKFEGPEPEMYADDEGNDST